MRGYKRIAASAAVLAAIALSSASAQNWVTTGNATGATDFLGTTNSTTMIFRTNNTNRMWMLNTGNIGLGTASPGTKFHVEQSGAPQVRLDDFTSTTAWDLWAGSNFLVRRVTAATDNMIYLDDVGHGVRLGQNSEVFIDLAAATTGRIGINNNNNHPAEKLIIGGGLTPGTDASAGETIGNASFRWNFIYATNNVINTSDARMKTDIRDIAYGIDDVMKLRPVSFTWKESPEDGRKLGMLAQELRQVIPEVVKGDEKVERLGVFYSDLIPVLIKGIQDQEGIAVKSARDVDGMASKAKQLDERLARIEAAITAQGPAGVGSPAMSANGVRQEQNDPNPTDGITRITYSVPSSITKAK